MDLLEDPVSFVRFINNIYSFIDKIPHGVFYTQISRYLCVDSSLIVVTSVSLRWTCTNGLIMG